MRLTQADFAERMAVTPLTVHRWKTGQSRPHAPALDRLRALEEAIAPCFLHGNSFSAAMTRAATVAITLNIALKMNHLEA